MSVVIDTDTTWTADASPYLITDWVVVRSEATLTVQPGVQVRFEPGAFMRVEGRLSAIGTAAAPIVFTGVVAEPGSWAGIALRGPTTAAPAQATLEHVVVEYGGRDGANLLVERAQLALSHGSLRHSSADGLRAERDGLTSTVELSQIVDNAEYGIYSRDPTAIVLAPNNWWGAPSGPTAECNPEGTGSRVSPGVAFRPFLATPNTDPGPLSPGDARILTVEPRRWFTPADDVTRLWLDITLRDGSGAPLAGRRVRVQSTLGRVTSGGVTDVEGRTLASVVSATPGEATVEAVLDTDRCEFARSATTEVQFTESDPGGDLLPDGQAPYMNERIQIIPEPVTRGVPTILRATVVNPNPFPLIVDGAFSYAQPGIGLTFGPIGEVRGQLVAADGEGVLEVEWVPTVSAHYCIEFQYTSRRQETGA
jgi:Bacterial Ig-like domain (group 1)